MTLFTLDTLNGLGRVELWRQIETNLDVRTAAVSGVIIVLTLVLMLLAERLAGLSRQLR